MFPYVVHVQRQGIRRYDIFGIDERQRAITARASGVARIHLEQSMGEMTTDAEYGVMETWYFETKDAAEAVARKFARDMPGRSIFVLELKNVYQAAVGDTVKMNYTEKGLVPA